MTKIEWVRNPDGTQGETWNPVTGCSEVSDGCKNCYAKRTAYRLRGRFGYPSDDPFRLTLHRDRLEKPAHWRKPRMVFVCSMGDLFHPAVPIGFIAGVWQTMYQNPQHIFQVLTKRPHKTRDWLKRCGDGGNLGWITHDGTEPAKAYQGTGIVVGSADSWPLSNVWLGTSVENQKNEWRIPILLQTQAAIRFISFEPLLGPIDFSAHSGIHCPDALGLIDWCIVGGESGPRARPMNPDWARSIRDQCQAAGIPFFFKQQGCWVTTERLVELYQAPGSGPIVPARLGLENTEIDGTLMWRVSKKTAGRVLDGRTWDEFPQEDTP